MYENGAAGSPTKEEIAVAGLEVKSVGSPEETRPFQDGKGNAAVVNVGGQPILYATFEPG